MTQISWLAYFRKNLAAVMPAIPLPIIAICIEKCNLARTGSSTRARTNRLAAQADTFAAGWSARKAGRQHKDKHTIATFLVPSTKQMQQTTVLLIWQANLSQIFEMSGKWQNIVR
jgi:hypothetical protein